MSPPTRQQKTDRISGPDSIAPDSRPFSMRLPRPLWIGLATILLVVVGVGLRFGVPLYQRRSAIREIGHFNGTVQVRHPRGPQWLREWIGHERMEWIDEPDHVVFWADEATLSRRSRFGGIVLATSGPLIDDAALTCVLGLPNLKSLDLAFSNVGDAGVEHISRLSHLEELRLEGSDVSDLSIPILSRMRSLRRLVVTHTQITWTGARQLQAALPGCDVQGPHNDPYERMW
jgi:hypothetical protein